MAWPSKMVSSVTLASAPFPELPGGEGQQSLAAGDGAHLAAPSTARRMIRQRPEGVLRLAVACLSKGIWAGLTSRGRR
jgi:hypothetical protein